jgi:hypothetical protein
MIDPQTRSKLPARQQTASAEILLRLEREADIYDRKLPVTSTANLGTLGRERVSCAEISQQSCESILQILFFTAAFEINLPGACGFEAQTTFKTAQIDALARAQP